MGSFNWSAEDRLTVCLLKDGNIQFLLVTEPISEMATNKDIRA